MSKGRRADILTETVSENTGSFRKSADIGGSDSAGDIHRFALRDENAAFFAIDAEVSAEIDRTVFGTLQAMIGVA